MKPATWFERLLITITLMTVFADAAVYIIQGEPAYVPRPPGVMKCRRSGCELLDRVFKMRLVV